MLCLRTTAPGSSAASWPRCGRTSTSTPAVEATSLLQGPAAMTAQSASCDPVGAMTRLISSPARSKPMTGVPSSIAAPRAAAALVSAWLP